MIVFIHHNLFNCICNILVKKPCPPGFPQVNQTLPSVYMVYWDPSESRVKGYSLERIIIGEMRNKRSLNLHTNNWTTVYSGSRNYMITKIAKHLEFIMLNNFFQKTIG